jgi:hypothetical protein
MGDRAEMSWAAVSGAAGALEALRTHKGPPVRVEALARDAKGLILGEQTSVIRRGCGDVGLGVPEIGLLLLRGRLAQVSTTFAPLVNHGTADATTCVHLIPGEWGCLTGRYTPLSLISVSIVSACSSHVVLQHPVHRRSLTAQFVFRGVLDLQGFRA